MAEKMFNFVIRQILLQFCEISQNNFVKILSFAKCLQCCFAATLCRSGGRGVGGGEGGPGPYHPSAPFPANADCA